MKTIFNHEFVGLLVVMFLLSLPILSSPAWAEGDSAGQTPRLRVIVETDAGGDPDDEQSMVRFLLYCNEWDVEGIICNRPKARGKENLNPMRNGLRIVQRIVKAYGECYPKLVQHDIRYPRPNELLLRTVPGYEDSDEGIQLILDAVDSDDSRPVWFMNWGTDYGSASSSLKRALDQVLKERGPSGYAAFKNRIRLSSFENFGDHTAKIEPPFKIWVNTFFPNVAFPGAQEERWYRRFSALTATAGGFDLKHDVLTDHGPLGALYPTNTTNVQKEGDTMAFLYLVPTGMNDPEQPTWGSWAGRYGRNEKDFPDRPYYWANAKDTWQGVTHRESTLRRWAVHLQNDFKARMDWCVSDRQDANHPPAPQVRGELRRTVASGDTVTLDASDSTDPDDDVLRVGWMVYPEPGSYRGRPPSLDFTRNSQASFVAPQVESPETIHLIVAVTDDGAPALTRYQRVIVTVAPQATSQLPSEN